MDTLWQDLRFGLRILLKKPGFTSVAVLTLALGIGGATTAYSALLPMVFDLPPVPEPHRVAHLWATNLRIGTDRSPASIPDFLDWREQSQTFEELAAFSGAAYHLTGADEPARASAYRVTAGFFRVLGVEPALGRAFFPGENAPGAGRIVILSHRLWQRSFSGDAGVLGRSVTLNSEGYTVVGVMPEGFWFPARPGTDLWVPLLLDPDPSKRGQRRLMVVGRLKPGATWKQAQAELGTIAQRLQQAHPGTNAGWGVRAVPLSDEALKKAGLGIVYILGPAILVLLIGCVNVANLLLARAAAREKEIAVRAALGASRLRLLRQLLTESTLLALLGGALGFFLALWGIDLVRSSLSGFRAFLAEKIEINVQVLGFALLLSILTPVLFGLVPALHASKPNLTEALKEGMKRPVMNLRGYRLPDLLVVLELVLAVPFLIVTLLFLGVINALESVEPGFNPKNLLTAHVSLFESRYPDEQRVTAFYRQALDRIAAHPGVQAVGAVDALPSVGGPRSGSHPVTLPEGSTPEAGVPPFPVQRTVSPGYFRAAGIPLRRGRDFSERDDAGSAPVALISETMARRYWPGEDPIGKTFKFGSPETESPWLTVVGVVGNVMINPRLGLMPLQAYLPHRQNPKRNLYLVVRTTGDPLNAVTAVKSAVWSVDKDQPLDYVSTLEQRLSGQFSGQYFLVGLIGAFSGLALALAAVGLYAVMSYSVAQRTHEIGVRMALGARPRDILRLMVGRGMALAVTGLGMGLAGTFALARLLAHEMVVIGTGNLIPFVVVLLLLFAVALLACYIPARRATKVDPMVALRCE
jgi:putative ABC transport system permease protein